VFKKNTLFFDVLKKTKIMIKEEEKRFEMIYPEKKQIVLEFEKFGYDVAVAIEEKGEMKGVIFLKEKKDKKVFTYRDQLLLINLGYMVGLSIENIKLYHQISEINSYIKNLLDNAPIGVISFDKEGKVSLLNTTIESILGKKEELLKKHFSKILPDKISSQVREFYENISKDIKIMELNFKDKIFNVITTSFFDEKSEFLGVQVIFTDMTKIKQLEDEIKRTEKLASLGVMAAGLAHEIKNPLVAIKTFAELFPLKYDDPEFREIYSNVLKDEVSRINNLIEQVLIFSRPQIPKIEEVNLFDVINSTISLMNYQFKNKQVSIIKKFPEKDVIIKGDKERLKQVFLNIILNSFEAVNHNNGLVEIEINEKEDFVEILIADNGYGIKEEIMDKIFDPFFTTKEKGTGLGLSIVLRIIEDHKGKIRIESKEKMGTKVYVELPKRIF
ncbi:MAG: ATP-binding protein, partial [bacterium]|nr:ATP-binding protein [bacterium]MDW8164477.1 ATP-binding protein [Candidatus Omnitrophota bacterium]